MSAHLRLCYHEGSLLVRHRVYTKRYQSVSKAGKPAGADTIEKAMTNLNKVANVVDKQRLKILLPLLSQY